jgi:hypothetical protein
MAAVAAILKLMALSCPGWVSDKFLENECFGKLEGRRTVGGPKSIAFKGGDEMSLALDD